MNSLNIYNELISRRITNPATRGDLNKHHIIPTCMGGSDDHNNIVKLSIQEHFLAHWLLTRIYPYHRGLKYAFNMMCKKDGVRVNSTTFAKSQLEAATVHSKNMLDKWEVDTEYRGIMSRTIREARIQDWQDPIYREREVERLRKLAVCEERKDALRNWFKERDGAPWLLPNAQKTRTVWGLAQIFWEVNRNNHNATEVYSAAKFCFIFNENLNISIFKKMDRLFTNGWRPKEDARWFDEFGHLT